MISRITHMPLVMNMMSFVMACTFVPQSSVADDAVQEQPWAEKTFQVKTHDFGTVPAGQKAEYDFQLSNPLDVPIHVREIKRSCGCTTPTIESRSIQPGESTNVHVKFNTEAFKGKKGATLTVVFDKPKYAEVQLRVDGFILSNLTLRPARMDFGKIKQGQEKSITVKLDHVGNRGWSIVKLESKVPWLTAEAQLMSRRFGKVSYQIKATVGENAPEGILNHQLVLISNERGHSRVPLQVSGSIGSAIHVAPQTIAKGSLKVGESIEKRIVVKADNPFRLQNITCEGWSVVYPKPEKESQLYLLNATFTLESDTPGSRIVVEQAEPQSLQPAK